MLDLSLKDVLTLILAAIASTASAAGVAFAVVRWVLHKEFTTREDAARLGQVVKDAVDDLQQQIDDSRHAHELLKKDVEALPKYRQIDELKDTAAELKQGQAVGREKLDGLKEELGLLRASFDRLAEDLRRTR